jgi:acetyl-CoA C-acetyltransferase/acetyl-CoA acyltransferase
VTVHISGVGIGPFGRRSGHAVDLGAEAASRALEMVGRRPVDLVVVANMLNEALGGEANLASRLASRLGLDSASALRVESSSASGAAAFQTAVMALEAGRYERALVVATEKMTDRPTAEVTRALALALAPEEYRAGATMAGLAAIVGQRYSDRYAADPTVFDRVSVHDRRGASRNPNAQFPTEVTLDQVRASRMVASPLRLLHCASIADGATAVVLERGSGPVEVRGFGQGLETFRVIDRIDLTTFAATRIAAKQAYEVAHITRKELDVVELHDAFAPFALIDLEDIGVAGPGEAAQWFNEDWVRADGRLPVNPSGGVLGRGHPVGTSSLCEIAEVALQIGGTAGAHQVARPPRVGLAQSISGLASQCFVTILGAGAS